MEGDENKGTEGMVIKTSDGEKILKTDEVQNLFDSNTELTKNVTALANVSKTLERYGTDADTYLSNAEAAFGVISDLTSKGLIDDQGNVLDKKGKDAGSEGEAKEMDFSFADDSNSGGKSGNDKTLQLISKVVDTKLGGLMKQIDDLSSGQAGLFRSQLKSKVQAKHSTFTDEDVSKLFGIASANPGKDLWGHAEDMAKGKTASETTEREKHAKEFGIDLKAFDENKLKEQSADGGTVAMFPGKKFVFGKRAKRLGTKDAVNPRDAMVAHLQASKKAQ